MKSWRGLTWRRHRGQATGHQRRSPTLPLRQHQRQLPRWASRRVWFGLTRTASARSPVSLSSMNAFVESGTIWSTRPSIFSALSFSLTHLMTGLLCTRSMGKGSMPFVQITDVGTTARQKLTPHRRLTLWERAAGVCCLRLVRSTDQWGARAVGCRAHSGPGTRRCRRTSQYGAGP